MTREAQAQTAADKWVTDQVRGVLADGEELRSAAYFDTLGAPGAAPFGTVGSFVDAARAKAFHAVLTDRRLILIACRVGAFGPLRENKGIHSIGLSQIAVTDVSKGRFGKAVATLTIDGKPLRFRTKVDAKYLSTAPQFFNRLAAATREAGAT